MTPNETLTERNPDAPVTEREKQGDSPRWERQGRRGKWTLPLLLVLFNIAVYANGLTGEFVFDDKIAIVDNPNIRGFGGVFEPVGTQDVRPVVFASLALNHALGGLRPVGYHVFNLVIHILAMLILWTVVRSTLLLPGLRARFRRASRGVAFSIALIWSLHPIQTECVSYVFQRGESMQALFYLFAILGHLRSATSRGPKRAGWMASVLVASVLGMGCKATFITLPATLLLYDRVFLCRAHPETTRQRGYRILGVGVIVVIVGVTTLDLHGMVAGYFENTPPEDVAFSIGYATTPMEYIRSQPTVILRYLGFAFWPDGLCLDYWMNPVESVPQIVVTSAALLSILMAAGIVLRRVPPLGFCLAFVFLVLSPTTLYWKMELMFTYRMYLPLAGLVSFMVVACHLLLGRLLHARRLSRPVVGGIELASLILVAGALGGRTVLRNRDFQDQTTLYRSVVATVPENPRGHYNLANRIMERYRSLKKRGRDSDADAELKRAIVHYQEAVRLFPKYIEANINLAIAYGLDGKTDELIERLDEVVSWDPRHQAALYNLAQAHRRRGIRAMGSGHRDAAEHDLEAAAARYKAFLAEQPSHPAAVYDLGITLYLLGRHGEAVEAIRRYLALEPASERGRALLRRMVSPATPYSRQPGQR